MPWAGRNSTPVRPPAGNEEGGLCSRIADKSYKEPPGPNESLFCQQIDLKDSMNHCVPNWDMENGIIQTSDFLPMAKVNWDYVQPQKRSMMLEHDIEELLWENGQVVNKVVKRSLPTQLSKTLQNDDAVLPGKPSPVGKDNTLESVVHDMSAANASSIHEDVMDSWLHYPLDDSLEKEYCSDFFVGMPSTNVHMLRDSLAGQMNNVPSEKVSNLHVQKESSLSSESNSVPWTGVFVGMVNTTNAAGAIKTGKESPPKSISSDKAMALGAGRASGIIPQSGTDTFAKVRTTTQLPVSKWHTDVQGSSSSKDDQPPCKKSATQVSVSPLSMPPPKMQATDLASMKLGRSKLVNFSHFSRPAAAMKANLQSIGSASGLSTTGIQNRLDKIRMDGNATAEPSIIESNSTGMTTIGSSSGANSRAQDNGSCQTCQNPPLGKNLDVATCSEDVTDSSAKASEQVVCQNSDAGRSLASCGTEKCGDAGDGPEPTITSSSGGSGNSAGRAGKEATNTSKRKGRDLEDSECQSEDVEYESADTKKQAPSRTTTSKRSRAAEVHNLSERRRRDRINEKMRALQELIPHCNKSDKASMLDEAIEYLKTLQLQVQIMSMGGGMGMPPLVFPGGMQHFQVPQMAHLSPMGMGIGMGYSMGMLDMAATSGRPVMSLPSMHVSALPGSAIHCQAALPLSGMPGPSIPMSRLPGPGLQVSGLPVSTIPVSGLPGTTQPGLVSTSASGSTDLQDHMQNANVMGHYKHYMNHHQMQGPPQVINGNLYNASMAQPPPQNPVQSSGRGIHNAASASGKTGTTG